MKKSLDDVIKMTKGTAYSVRLGTWCHTIPPEGFRDTSRVAQIPVVSTLDTQDGTVMVTVSGDTLVYVRQHDNTYTKGSLWLLSFSARPSHYASGDLEYVDWDNVSLAFVRYKT